jgi:hypothetical protein
MFITGLLAAAAGRAVKVEQAKNTKTKKQKQNMLLVEIAMNISLFRHFQG